MKTMRVGFVGFGFIGKVHACAYAELPFHYAPLPLLARITHICSGRLETAEAGCAMVGASYATTDYREITENPAIDIVHICSPNHQHAPALLSAMAHQKHIYCEKPLAATTDEADAIRAALASYRGTAQMTLQNRFFPATIRARQLLGEGALGPILEFRAAYLHAGSADPATPLKWKLAAAAGGGVIADLGSHMLDLVHLMLGDYAALCALTQVAYADRPAADDPARRVAVDAEDGMKVMARMASGATGIIEATKLAMGSEDEVRLEIHGSRGALRFNCMDPHHLEYYDARQPDKPVGGTRGWTRIDTGQRYAAPATGFPTPKAAIGWTRCHLACLANFLYDIAAGRPGDPGLEQGIYLQHLMAAVKRSAADRAWVEPTPADYFRPVGAGCA